MTLSEALDPQSTAPDRALILEIEKHGFDAHFDGDNIVASMPTTGPDGHLILEPCVIEATPRAVLIWLGY